MSLLQEKQGLPSMDLKSQIISTSGIFLSSYHVHGLVTHTNTNSWLEICSGVII